MAMSIAEFMQKESARTRGRPTILAGHRTEILALREKGYTYKQIQAFLKANGVNVSAQTIAGFVHRTKPAEKDPAKSVRGTNRGRSRGQS
ncbi:hypothetical protein [Burkholderia sp. LMG 13014]|uniref:hypothetical protein n=1 Tax=Burkholderia sp. LMG 13014 TaxID=2709306 RepID=UPI001965DAFA|nr:hypothetical protein [Burkholderia sp. LMG 13014]